MHVSTADWVVIAVVAVAGLYGIATGFLRGAFSLAGFAVGAYLGARIAPLILSDGSPYIPVVALGGAILLGTLMRGLAGMLAGMLRTSIGVIPGMRLLDRFAGLVLGLVAGVFLCWAIGAVLLYLPGETELRRSVQRSLILSEINDVVPPERLLEELERVDPIGVFLGPPAIVAPPDKGLAKDPDVVRASNSVVRVTGSCMRGTGRRCFARPLSGWATIAGGRGDADRIDALELFQQALGRNDVVDLVEDQRSLPRAQQLGSRRQVEEHGADRRRRGKTPATSRARGREPVEQPHAGDHADARPEASQPAFRRARAWGGGEWRQAPRPGSRGEPSLRINRAMRAPGYAPTAKPASEKHARKLPSRSAPAQRQRDDRDDDPVGSGHRARELRGASLRSLQPGYTVPARGAWFSWLERRPVTRRSRVRVPSLPSRKTALPSRAPQPLCRISR